MNQDLFFKKPLFSVKGKFQKRKVIATTDKVQDVINRYLECGWEQISEEDYKKI